MPAATCWSSICNCLINRSLRDVFAEMRSPIGLLGTMLRENTLYTSNVLLLP